MARSRPHRAAPRCGQSGVASIEFVIVFPVLLLLFFGLVNFAHYMNSSMKIAQAAVLATDLVTRTNRNITEADFTEVFTAVELAVTPLPIANIRVDIYDYYGAGTLRWKKSSPNGPNCDEPNPSVGPIKSLLTPSSPTPATDVIAAVVCMPYVAPVPSFPGLTQLFSNIVIRRAMYLRPRISTELVCPTC